MPTDEWERGYADGWYAAMRQQRGLPQYGAELADEMQREYPIKSSPKKPKRKASAYSKRYGAAFREVAPRFKKKNGSWKTDGFKKAQKAAHKIARRN